MLTENAIKSASRILLNEAIPAFWLEADFTTWCAIAAMDISSRTFCYEITSTFSFATDTQFYNIGVEYLRLLAVVNTTTGLGLKKAAPQMQGIQTGVSAGPPEFYYDFASQIGVFPIPTVTENGQTIRIFLAAPTSVITNIPDRFTLPATLLVTAQAKVKERQFGQAAQLLNFYNSLLGGDRSDVLGGKLAIPSLETYRIPNKVVVAGQTNG